MPTPVNRFNMNSNSMNASSSTSSFANIMNRINSGDSIATETTSEVGSTTSEESLPLPVAGAGRGSYTPNPGLISPAAST